MSKLTSLVMSIAKESDQGYQGCEMLCKILSVRALLGSCAPGIDPPMPFRECWSPKCDDRQRAFVSLKDAMLKEATKPGMAPAFMAAFRTFLQDPHANRKLGHRISTLFISGSAMDDDMDDVEDAKPNSTIWG